MFVRAADRPVGARLPLLARLVALAGLTFVLGGLTGCGGPPDEVDGEGDGVTPTPTSTTAARGQPWEIAPFGDPDWVGDGATPPASTEPPTSPDALAGVLSREVPQSGDGDFDVVPGSVAAPVEGADRIDVAVSIEGGLDVDGPAFAAFVMDTLNDSRSWPHDGYSFARTDDDPDVTVMLASPDTSAELCRPLQTNGTLSCRNGGKVVLTYYRWVNGMDEYGEDRNGYRHYLVNHEVGHYVGHGHVGCPGRGEPAPVMMQQTLGLQGCAPNPWPYP